MTKRTLPYPDVGDPCNGCGDCCLHQLCPVSMNILRVAPGDVDQPCPFLEWQPDGSARCGVILDPAKTAPVLTAIHGEAKVRRAAELVLSIGTGCTSQPERATAAQYAKMLPKHRKIMESPDYAEAERIFPVHPRYIS